MVSEIIFVVCVFVSCLVQTKPEGTLAYIDNLHNSAIQSEIIFILRIWQRGSLSQSTMTPNRDVLTANRDAMSAKCVFS